jgi:hypothetical protein
MADKIITIAEYADSMKAELARQLLEDFGIRAVVVDQNAANLGLPSMLAMTAKLQVFESDAARAAEILESAESEYNVDEAGELEDLEDFNEFGGPEEQE